MKKAWKTIGALAAVILTAVLLRGCVATSYFIPSHGMENALYRGERVLVNKWSYGLRLPLMRLWGYRRWCEHPVQQEDIVVFNNPANRTQPVIDRREVFIGRCAGSPGDTLMVDSLFSLNPDRRLGPDQKFLYTYPRERETELLTLLDRLSIRNNPLLGNDSASHVRCFSRYEYYLLEQAIAPPCWIRPADEPDTTTMWYPLVIPARGKAVEVTPWNRTLLCNTLLLHESRRAEVRGDSLYVDGRAVTQCCFTKDYCWISLDNPTTLHDSRLFGFVPMDHVIGRAAWVWFSKEEGRGLFGGFRWERMGMQVK